MKKGIKTIFQKHFLFLLGVILGTLLTSTTVFAVILYQSINVGFNSGKTRLEATNVQAAIDELDGKIDSIISNSGGSGGGVTPPSGTTFTLNYLEDDNETIIESYVYSYDEGMTWYDFVESSYNTDGFEVDGKVIIGPIGLYVRTSSGTQVRTTDLINAVPYIMSEDLCCFEPETLITIDLEGNTKKIKDIEVGDTIVVENVNTKEKQLTTVLKDASEHPKTFDFTEITLESGIKLKFNSYHPIYTTEGYKSVTNYNNYPTLEVGDYAVNANNEKNKIIKINRYMNQNPEMTYNLLIKGIEEFYLEEEYAYIANNTLVHTGIAEYDDEDEWRAKNRYKCIQQDVYKDFNYDKAPEEELIKYLVELKVSNEDAFNEYIKYYISADQYYRYAKIARIIKDKSRELSNINTLHYTTKNKNNKLK